MKMMLREKGQGERGQRLNALELWMAGIIMYSHVEVIHLGR